MIFVDRLILANYSLQAMNAATLAGVIFIVLSLGSMTLAAIAEVFAAQYNGSRQYHLVSRPVWQMIWFSVMMGVLFWLIALFATPLLLSEYYYEEHGRPYFQWMLYLGLMFPLQASLASFYIGIGKLRLLAWVTVLGNLTNIGLDYLLIFGHEPLLSPLGTTGAAVATGIAQSLQAVILLAVFLNQKNREKYGTGNVFFHWPQFAKCLQVGGPAAIGLMIELSAWAMVNRMMSWVSEDHLTVISIGKSFFILIAFAIHSIEKAVTAVAANLIGERKIELINKGWRSGAVLLLFCAAIIAPIYVFYPDLLIYEFLTEENGKLFSTLQLVCLLVWIYFIFDGLTWVSAGVLTAAGDTLFVMGMNAFTAWFFALIPIWLIVVKWGAPPEVCWLLLILYSIVNSLLFYLRYKGGSWKKRAHLV